MRIRTRYKLFKAIMVAAVLVFALTLYDMFANEAGWQAPLLIAYVLLIALGLLLYVGYKPTLVEPGPLGEPVAEPVTGAVAEEEAVVELAEVPKRRAVGVRVEGPHAFRCPFCSQVFALEATHLDRTSDFRMNCPYCANNIRVPRRPKVAPGDLRPLAHAPTSERVLFTCNNCGEVLRFTAPDSRLERALTVSTCPNCRSPSVALAAPA